MFMYLVPIFSPFSSFFVFLCCFVSPRQPAIIIALFATESTFYTTSFDLLRAAVNLHNIFYIVHDEVSLFTISTASKSNFCRQLESQVKSKLKNCVLCEIILAETHGLSPFYIEFRNKTRHHIRHDDSFISLNCLQLKALYSLPTINARPDTRLQHFVSPSGAVHCSVEKKKAKEIQKKFNFVLGSFSS